VLRNGKVSILDAGNTVVQAIALRDGKVLAIGTTDQVKNAAGSGAQLIAGSERSRSAATPISRS
jgi:hypothetical protein